MQIRTLAALTLIASLAAFPALALDLHAARTAGSVAEKSDGYAEALSKDAEVVALVAEVNAKRKAEYTRISKENGQSVSVVAKLAAPQIISGLEPGSPYKDEKGALKKR